MLVEHTAAHRNHQRNSQQYRNQGWSIRDAWFIVPHETPTYVALEVGFVIHTAAQYAVPGTNDIDIKMHILPYLVRRAVGKNIKYQLHPVKTTSDRVFGTYRFSISNGGLGAGEGLNPNP